MIFSTNVVRWPLLGLVLLAAPVAAAPPSLTFLYPAGASQGKTVPVNAGGSFERWPVGAWVSGAGVTIKPEKEKGRLAVTVAADATPGLRWLRLNDDQGASNLRPFFVGTLPEVVEEEPNDDPKKPQKVPAQVVVNGRLGQRGDVDHFAVPLKKSQTLVASMEAHLTLRSPMDGVLQIVSADGFVLAHNHDDHDLDPQIVFQAPADGDYLVRAFAFPAEPDTSIQFAGGPTYIYRLTLTTGGFVDHAFPLAASRLKPSPIEMIGWNIPEAARKHTLREINTDDDRATLSHPLLANTAEVRLEPHSTQVEKEPNDPKTPQMISLPVTISGRIDPPGDVDAFAFTARKGKKLLFRVESRTLGQPLDPVLRLTDAAGKLQAQVDDAGDGGRDPELAFTPPADGIYRIEVRDLHGDGGFRYAYRLRATPAEPDFDLTVAADRFVVTPGKPLDIPVTVEKREGMDRDVEVTAIELPKGVTATAVMAKGGGKVTAVLRITPAAGASSGAFRIVGQAAEPRKVRRIARCSLPELNNLTTQFWMTVGK